ncbi:MAG: DUF1553 domain-containing protein [Phycisphaeraceae bacterium]
MRTTLSQLLTIVVALGVLSVHPLAADKAAEPTTDLKPYSELVVSDDPVAYWQLNEEPSEVVIEPYRGSEALRGQAQGFISLSEPGPRPEAEGTGFPAFSADNTAANFDGLGSHIAVDDDGSLTFGHGDTITAEAWVNPDSGNGANSYIVGKGRTFNSGFSQTNQNWALRLHDGGSRIGFLFRSAAEHDTAEQTHTDEWHRWTSDRGLTPGAGWHHIALTYTFGEPDSIQGYINGEPVDGEWDMGGPTTSGPVVDGDQVWLGSAMGGHRGNSFDGGLDEVAIYRKALPAERIAARYEFVPPPSVAAGPAPNDAVRVEILEGVPNREWDFRRPAPVQTYKQDAMAFIELPRKYNEKGLIIDRSAPYMVRANTRVNLPAGEYQMLLRSLNGARLYMDGEELATTNFNRLGGHAHHDVEPLPTTDVDRMPKVRQIPAAHSERFVAITTDGGEHEFKIEAFIGGPQQRFDVGELVVAIATADGPFHLLSPHSHGSVLLTDQGWREYGQQQRLFIRDLNTERRAEVGAREAEYWTQRHEFIRNELAESPLPSAPSVSDTSAVFNDIDRYINARLEEAGIDPAPLANDYQFLRRLALDTVGVVPSPEEIEEFFADPPETRRSKAIDRFLADPRWADNWVGYWQDVLAENPPLINAALNNTGAFRWYLYEAMLDNRPMDRFATELVMMEGSLHYGGPAGFGRATQNDVPMAEKAHTLSQAFMGMEMSCARCHDAPFGDVKQEDVFAMAAMLGRSAQTVPVSSSVPGTEAELQRMLIDITLPPGSSVEPFWPFDEILDGDVDGLSRLMDRNPNDTRARLAGLMTWHRNQRFAPVVANRIWRRYIGFGLVEPVDNWQDFEPSHPELLAYLARELKMSGYDLKHMARLIFESHTYQRAVVDHKAEPVDQFTHLYASPPRRRMTAEQVVDSLFAVAGKRFDAGPLTHDAHSGRPVTSMNHLGVPERAWHMTTLANERDRPSLNLPVAQTIVEVLEAFGWRGSRPNPLTVRSPMPSVRQSALMANGVLSRRITGLSEQSAFTAMALSAEDPEQFIDDLFMRILSREPSSEERAVFRDMVADGFDNRVVANPPAVEYVHERREKVTWRNHLSPEANDIKLAIEREIRLGDPPTARLESAWRERAEDVVWTLINSPEFLFVP